ncbi:MAG: GGDEF domain-containing protein [Chlorobi bacterium]|nr:GGDEF domain-containing protein [Chlorobiota bacterium]
MSDASQTNQPARLQRITMAGTIFLLLTLFVTVGFMLYRNELVENLRNKQALYLDLVEFREKITTEGTGAVPQKSAKVMQFMLGKVLESAEAAGEKEISGALIQKRGGLQPFADADREIFLLALDNSIGKAETEVHRALDACIRISNIFVMTVLVLFILLITGSWREFYRTYTMTLIPLSRLSEKIGTINRCIPESIHETAEDIRNDLTLSPHSRDICRITDTMAEFCMDIEAKNKKLDELHIRDEKTNLYNYRHFKEHLIMEIERSKRAGDMVSIAMIDIDHFKQYNDEHGHVAGDRVLAQLAGIISSQCRTSDMPSRFGGEEFAVLFPRTDHETTLQISERLRMIICAEPVAHEKHQPEGRLTVSIGIATFPGDAPDWYTLVNNADRALYRAKSAGRNRVCAFSAIRNGEEGK